MSDSQVSLSSAAPAPCIASEMRTIDPSVTATGSICTSMLSFTLPLILYNPSPRSVSVAEELTTCACERIPPSRTPLKETPVPVVFSDAFAVTSSPKEAFTAYSVPSIFVL